MKRFPLLLALGCLAFGPSTLHAQDDEEELSDELVETEGSINIGGESVAYRAHTGRMVLRRENGEPRASIFYVAYFKDGVEDAAKRPLTVCFNGGPGSSSVWLHLGAYGPRRIDMGPEGMQLEPPYTLVDNEHSLLDLTDMLFIDPVMTGYSRPAEGEDKSQFHGLTEDVESVGEFIRLFVSRHKRWESPLFLSGESYGTTRAAALSRHLQGRLGMYLSGIVLVSAVLNFQTHDMNVGNDLPYPVILPSFTATAWYHGRLDQELQADLRATLDEVEEFALGEYTLALMQGDRLDAATADAIATKLARYLGVSKEFVQRNNLRVGLSRFCKELRRDERRTVGRLDSRYVGIDRDAGGARYDYDPSYAAIQGPYSMTLNHYVRAELGYESDLPYEILTGRVRPWSYSQFENAYVDVSEDLRRAMTTNQGLKVLIANGYYDLATPYFATEYTLSHLGLDPSLRGNVSMTYYESGHMMYVRRESLARLKADIAAFYAETLAD